VRWPVRPHGRSIPPHDGQANRPAASAWRAAWASMTARDWINAGHPSQGQSNLSMAGGLAKWSGRANLVAGERLIVWLGKFV
jgi:hypothetical protein